MATFLLVHSPLVGPAVWASVAGELVERGHRAVLPDTRLADGDPAEQGRLAAAAVEPDTAGDEGVVVAVYSGAGVSAPSVVASLAEGGVAVRQCLFVDAQLPRPGRPTDDEFLAFLRERVGPDGRLPPFASWWGEEVLAGLVPDPAQRAALVADCPRLPIACYERPAPATGMPAGLACAYLHLSEGYDDVAASARDRGWPVAAIEADHLALLTRPVEVTEALEGLLR